MLLDVIKKRSSLPHARAALERGTLNIGFIGGSITESRDFYRSYSDHVSNGIAAHFPDARIIFQNAGIGGTMSTLGAFRVKKDIIDPGCDLVFVEYAVNDFELESGLRMETREGLLRQLLEKDHCDVVFVYTYVQTMYEDMVINKMPESIADFEKLAEYYNISSVWMGLHAMNKVREGVLRWEEWLPDGLHPNVGGSRFYAEPVLDFIIKELESDDKTSFTFKVPMTEKPWDSTNISIIPLEDINWKNPWKLRRLTHRAGHEQFLDTSAIGAELEIPFEGTGIFIGLITGLTSAYFDYCIDSGEWQSHEFEYFDWMLENNWYQTVLLANKLPFGEHTLKIRTKHANVPMAQGTRTDIALVGVLK